MSTIYKGPSEGFTSIAEGYVDYAKEVISGRAVPDVRDGLKPVTRRILYSSNENDEGRLRKCIPIVSDALKLHPHGDGSVYGAFVLLTDENGSCNLPFFHAMGNLGKVYSSDPPAAMRYTKAMLNNNAKDFFTDKEAINLVVSEEGDGVEPLVLPARYPVVLVNGAEGIAVSTGTKMPSFNMLDVLELTKKYITNQGLTIKDRIMPDFPTGGVLVANDEEVTKIMLTGKGKLKVRAKVEIEGKNILVKEVPYGKTVEGILRNIKDNDIMGLSSAINTVGHNSKAFITITCKSKNVVENVLLNLYRMNILQSTFASNILVIEDGTPKILGVYGIIETWVAWRKEVLKVKFSRLLESIRAELITLDYFIKLVSNEETKDEYVRRLTKESKKSCTDYLLELFPEIPIDVVAWIYDRKGSAFNKGGNYLSKYENMKETEVAYMGYLENPEPYIVSELDSIYAEKLNEGYGTRKTEITYKDYRFSKISDTNEILDTSYCVYTLKKDGFLLKTRTPIYEDREDILCEIHSTASSVLVGFDNFGRLLRVQGKEIPFTNDDQGVYMAKYFDATFEQDYKVLYLCNIDGTKKLLVYRDGYMGYFDTAEFVGKKNTKIVNNGVCLAVRDKLLHIYEESEIPDNILLADDSSDRLKMGVVTTDDIPERSRTSRAKVLQGNDIDTKYIRGFNGLDIATRIQDVDDLIGKLKWFRGEFYGEPFEIPDGDYLNICTNLE